MYRSPLIDFGTQDRLVVDNRVDLSEFEWCVEYCKKNNLEVYVVDDWKKAKLAFQEHQK